MTMAAPAWKPQMSWRPQLGRTVLLWGGAAVLAALAHGGAVWMAMQRPESDALASPPPAVMIELAPEAVAPQSDMMEVAPDLTDQEEVVAPEQLDTPDQPTMVEDQLTPPTDFTPLTPPPDLAPAPVPPTVIPEVVLPPPVRQEEKPPPVKAEKKAEKAKPPAPKKQQQAAKSDAAAPAAKAAAPETGTGATGKATAAWQARLSAHLNRKKRYPSGSQSRREEGVAQVRFAIDASGKILSSKLIRSSGYPDLDAEVAALMTRASPVPAPPPGVPLTVTVPIRFNVR